MPTTIVQQRVREFSTWKIAFDEMKDLRFSSGAFGDQIYRDDSDPNKITIILKWNTLANARRYYSSPEQKAAMSRGGVEGMAEISFLNEA